MASTVTSPGTSAPTTSTLKKPTKASQVKAKTVTQKSKALNDAAKELKHGDRVKADPTKSTHDAKDIDQGKGNTNGIEGEGEEKSSDLEVSDDAEPAEQSNESSEIDDEPDEETHSDGVDGESKNNNDPEKELIQLPKAKPAEPRVPKAVNLPEKPSNPFKAPSLQPNEDTSKVRAFRPDLITPPEWAAILRNNQFLHGFRRGFTDDQKVDMAAAAAFNPPAVSEKSAPWPSFHVADKAELSITETTSMMESSLLKQGFDAKEVEASVNATFETFSVGVGGGVGNSKDVIQSWAAKTEAHTLIGQFYVPYLQLILDGSTLELSEKCRAQVEQIIQKRDYDEVGRFLSDFGSFFPQRVLLGGQLWTSETVRVGAGASSDDTLTKFSASLKATVDVPLVLKGSLSTTWKKQDQQVKENSNSESEVVKRWSSWGGDDLLVADPQKWRESVRNITNWRALKYSHLESMVSIIGKKAPYSTFPDIVATVLATGKPPPLSLDLRCYSYDNVDNPELNTQVMGAQRAWKTLSLNQGLDSRAGQYRDRPFKHPAYNDFPRVRVPSEVKWQVLDGISLLTSRLNASIQGMDFQSFNLFFAPLYLSHMKVSTDKPSYSISVILEWYGEGRVYRPENAEKVEIFPEAAEALLKSPSEFFTRYGDYFISDLCRQSCVTAVWTISFGRNRKAMEEIRSNLKQKFGAAPPSPEEGASFIRDLMRTSPTGVTCLVNSYTSSSNTGTMVHIPETSNLNRTVSCLSRHTNNSDDIITRIWLLPYGRVLRNTLPINVPSQVFFLKWAASLKNVYHTFNELRALPAEVVLHASAEKELRDAEAKLLMNQRNILSGDLSSLGASDTTLEQLRRRIQLADESSEVEFQKKCISQWLSKAKEAEASQIARLDNVTRHFAGTGMGGTGELIGGLVASTMYDNRGTTDGYGMFGSTEAPDDWGTEMKRKFQNALVTESKKWEYRHSIFDNEWRDTYDWSIDKPGHKLIAWEVTNHWKQGVWGLGPGGTNVYRVGRADWRVSFKRTRGSGYSVGAKTWWVPADLCL